MNKTAIKNFAVWARNKLIAEITYKAGLLGITENGIAKELPNSEPNLKLYDIGTKEPVKIQGNAILQRKALADKISVKASEVPYKKAFEYVIEEVAYTWFNRLIAIRYMEVKTFLPVRVLSSESKGKKEPDMVTTPFETEIEFSDADRETMLNLKDDDLFRFLFIKQCNQLHEYLPELFEQTDNYTELLLPISFTDEDGIVYHLVNDISEEDFGEQVQIIGWLYQYYNTEPKAKVDKKTEKGGKVDKEELAPKTQLFTPDWIVRYMVENSLGRIWGDGHEDYDKSEWKYYLAEAEQEESVKAQLDEIRKECKNLSPEDIKFLDPCMGSGHILVYAFDVFMQIYLSQGYTERDAASKIIENNLFGLDIDKRAYQLSYFALMMKGREADRRFLKRDIKPNLANFAELNAVNSDALNGKLKDFAEQFKNADTYGSLLEVSSFDSDEIAELIENLEENIFTQGYAEILKKMLNAYKILSQRYEICCTNPPYMGSKFMDAVLSDFVKKNYNDSKSDLFAVFIEKCGKLSKHYYAMITQHSWMFLSSYVNLRTKLLSHTTINMAHLGSRAFDEISGEVVQTTAFINSIKRINEYKENYVRLVDISGEKEKAEMFLRGVNRYKAKKEDFSVIPGSPIAYWISANATKWFALDKNLGSIAEIVSGMTTGNNDIYLKLWYEVNILNISFNNLSMEHLDLSKTYWIPYNKGGVQRKWYGNNEYVVNWSQSNNFNRAKTTMTHLYLQPCITWSDISGTSFAGRYCYGGFMFDVKGSCGFSKDENSLLRLISTLNSPVTPIYIEALNPTTTTQVGDLKRIPLSSGYNNYEDLIIKHAKSNITISKSDWDSFETSWDFTEHPLVKWAKSLWDATAVGATMSYYYGENTTQKYNSTIELCYLLWKGECNDRFNKLKANEEELNRIFIDIYELQDELTPKVEDKDVTVHIIYDTASDIPDTMKKNSYSLTKRDVIVSFISYAVGCMFGRYSLDTDGLAYAGGDWDNSKYKTFIPDADNCIPITDTDYFSDDIVNRFVEFVKVVYGEDTLEENLKFIADALGNRGVTSRDVIREYFMKDFMKDHIKMYQKRPIYWLFDSGKQNGFKALVYMHRWNTDTIGNVRVEYLHKLQRIYDRVLEDLQDTIDNSNNSKDIAKAEKQKDKITKQLKETRDYDEKIAHLALMQIDIDLDDGVKVNYEKVQTADGKNLEILAKI